MAAVREALMVRKALRAAVECSKSGAVNEDAVPQEVYAAANVIELVSPHIIP